VHKVYRNGDVNGDGVININDALEILKFLAGVASVVTEQPGAANAPTINDALEILKRLAGLPNDIV